MFFWLKKRVEGVDVMCGRDPSRGGGGRVRNPRVWQFSDGDVTILTWKDLGGRIIAGAGLGSGVARMDVASKLRTRRLCVLESFILVLVKMAGFWDCASSVTS
jgi:hypothetical protein